MKIGIIGAGHVGLVAGACFASFGRTVTCCESNQDKIKLLKNHTPPFFEPGLEKLLLENQSRLNFIHDGDLRTLVEQNDLIFIAVGTPENEDGSADLSFVEKSVRSICSLAQSDKIIAIKSTVPVGTANRLQYLAKLLSRHKISIAINPEFLAQGTAIENFINPDRVILGSTDVETLNKLIECYDPIITSKKEKLLLMDASSAELAKYASNCFLALKISFINEMALLADSVGARISDVKRGLTSDRRIGKDFFSPGIGFGGSCFPKDLHALLKLGEQHQIFLHTIDAADKVNERQKYILYQRLQERFQSLLNRKICLWGLSFKAQTDDTRRSPAVALARKLLEAGAHVTVYDPMVKRLDTDLNEHPHFEFKSSELEAATGAEALLILTDWTQFQNTPLKILRQKMKSPIIFDGRNLLESMDMINEGFEYYGIGQKNLSSK